MVFLKFVQDQELHASKVVRSPRQSALVSSFATTFPELLDSEDFSKLSTYADFNQGDGTQGVQHTLMNGFREEGGALRSHIRVELESHPEALKPAFTILADTYSWVVWFVDAFKNDYHTLVAKASGLVTSSASATTSVKKSCWKRVLGSL